MKLVRENLFEKFAEDTDPITDMGIGTKYMLHKFIKEVENNTSYGPRATIHENMYLNVCIEHNKINFVKWLVEKEKIDINKQYIRLLSMGLIVDFPLIHAIKFNRKEIIKYLIEQGADITIKSNGQYLSGNTVHEEYSVLCHAVWYSDVSLVKYLVDNGATYSMYPNDINNLAYYAAIYDKPKILEYFLLNGASVNELLELGLLRRNLTKIKNTLRKLKMKKFI